MVFGLFAKKDPICGMKQEKGKGIEKADKWFCSQRCASEYEKESAGKPSCCR